MTPHARALVNSLLVQHRSSTQTHPPGLRPVVGHYVIRYSVLCAAAGVPHVADAKAPLLLEVAEWCLARKFPPIQSLAIGEAGIPIASYGVAADPETEEWLRQLDACIRFEGYPASVPPPPSGRTV